MSRILSRLMPSSPRRSREAWAKGEELTKSPAPDGAGFFAGEQFMGTPLSRPLGAALKRLEGRSTPVRQSSGKTRPRQGVAAGRGHGVTGASEGHFHSCTTGVAEGPKGQWRDEPGEAPPHGIPAARRGVRTLGCGGRAAGFVASWWPVALLFTRGPYVPGTPVVQRCPLRNR